MLQEMQVLMDIGVLIHNAMPTHIYIVLDTIHNHKHVYKRNKLYNKLSQYQQTTNVKLQTNPLTNKIYVQYYVCLYSAYTQ